MSSRTAARKVVFPCLLSALVSNAPPAIAVEDPFHVEADVGRVTVDDIGDARIDESSTYFRLATGYLFLPWLGISGAFVDLGTIDSRVAIGGGTAIPVKASANGFELAVNGRIALSDTLSLRADAGVLRWKGDTRIGGVAEHESGSDSAWGLGVEYAFASRFMLTGGWRRYRIDDVDADTTWVGLKVRFGDTQ